MEKKYKITNEDYQKLWSGKVKYLIHFYQKRGYGRRTEWWNVIRYRLRSRYCSNKFGYPYTFQYYIISVHCPIMESRNTAWSNADMETFINEKQLRPGDHVFIYYTFPRDDGITPNGGGCEYVILKKGWQVLWNFMGA